MSGMKVRYLFASLVFAGCSFQASCGGKSLNMENAKKFVSTTLEADVGKAPTTVSCPEKVKIEKGAKFACTADYGNGAMATVEITQNDDQGNVTMSKISGILVAKRAEEAIAKMIGEQANVHVTAECGERVHPAKAGATIMCTAKDANGQTAQVEVLVKDTDGNVSMKVVKQ